MSSNWKKNLHGQKQAGRFWFKRLSQKINDIGFTQSAVDDNVFYKGACIYFFYVDNGIFLFARMKKYG